MSEHALTAADNLFLQDFAAHAGELPGAGTPWLDARRRGAIEVVRAKGVPNRRVEEWKYSDLRSALESRPIQTIARADWTIEALPDGVEMFDLAVLGAGAPDWVAANLGAVQPNAGAMDAVSLALARGGVALRIPRGWNADGFARLHFACAGVARVLIVVEDDAQFRLAQTHAAHGGGFANIGMEIVLGRNAHLTQIRMAPVDPALIAVENIAVRAARDACYTGHFVQFGARLSRTELRIALEGDGAQAHLSGASVLGGQTHADVSTYVSHAAANTRSRQLFKKVIAGHGRGVYQGRITVEEGAGKSDSMQTAKALLLNDRAEADLKPELIIFADDVKCVHGAAVGDLDPESLFYLRARGISEREARDLLMRAFLGEAVEQIADEAYREIVWQSVEQALSALAEGPL
jgi:Fe-S cluster assembly protein SufD